MQANEGPDQGIRLKPQSRGILFTRIKLLFITQLFDSYSLCHRNLLFTHINLLQLPNPFHLVYSNILVTNFKPHIIGGGSWGFD